MPVGEKTVAQKLVDAAAVRFNGLLAFRHPLTRQQRQFIGGHLAHQPRGIDDVHHEQPARG